MKVTFIGNPDDERDNLNAVKLFGVTFPLNVPVELPDEVTPAQRKKLAGNNHFAVEGYETEAPKVSTSTGEFGVDASAENVSAAAVGTIARAKPRRAKAEG